MRPDSGHRYPDCPCVRRVVQVGGLTKPELLQALQQKSVMLNAYAEQILACDAFTVSALRYSLATVELAVRDLGFPNGATADEIERRALECGLSPCPPELGPHLRLQYLDQSEGHVDTPLRKHTAPCGSVTIASQPLSDDDDFPKGFYLRRIDGALWLRGYRSDATHVWRPDDRFILAAAEH